MFLFKVTYEAGWLVGFKNVSELFLHIYKCLLVNLPFPSPHCTLETEPCFS